MRKLTVFVAALLATFGALAGASAANADDKHPSPHPSDGAPAGQLHEHDDDEYADIVISDGDSDEERRAHHELEIKYGKDGAFQIPPLFIKPGALAPESGVDVSAASVNGMATNGQVGSSNQGTDRPGVGVGSGPSTTIASTPIDFSKVMLHQTSPAETFIRWSTIALVGLAVIAIGIAGYLLFNRPARARLQDTEVEYSA